ncbi:hypothetical protein CR513_42613, partial [Mucuna pruriens]
MSKENLCPKKLLVYALPSIPVVSFLTNKVPWGVSKDFGNFNPFGFALKKKSTTPLAGKSYFEKATPLRANKLPRSLYNNNNEGYSTQINRLRTDIVRIGAMQCISLFCNMGKSMTSQKFDLERDPLMDTHISDELPFVVTLQDGNVLKGSLPRSFEGKYGKILGLKEVELQPLALSALLALTLEEYECILGLPLTNKPPYLYKGQYPSLNLVAKLLKVPE